MTFSASGAVPPLPVPPVSIPIPMLVEPVPVSPVLMRSSAPGGSMTTEEQAARREPITGSAKHADRKHDEFTFTRHLDCGGWLFETVRVSDCYNAPVASSSPANTVLDAAPSRREERWGKIQGGESR